MKLVILLWILANVLYLILGKRMKRTQDDLNDPDYLPYDDASKQAQIERREAEMKQAKERRNQETTL